MNTFQAALAILGALFALAAVAGGLYAAFRTASSDAANRRLREENTDLVRRLDYVEPKLAEALNENKLLRDLHNPTAQLERMSEVERHRHEEITRVLDQQSDVLEDIQRKVTGGTS